ncbi:MAG: PilC/PilY family type IV pilus protein, partial [Burkholderiales bacterium]|nr:PilC/PilY family type IV pilus protein [Burkholderiales bacterium]
SAWVDNTVDRCIVPEHVGLNNATSRVPVASPLEYCPFAQAYGVIDTLDLKMGPRPEYARLALETTTQWTRVYLRVQMPFREATVWVLNNDGLPLQADEAWAPDGKKIRRIVIDSATASYAKGPNRTDCVGATCSYAEEMTNFANWFAYYRKRFMMAYAALGLSFDQVSGLRGGFFFFGDRRNVTMFDFDNTDNRFNGRRLLNDIYRGKFPRGTPTREALEYAGNQFRRTDAGAPINAACQYNAAFVITDGFATASGPTGYGNTDADVNNRFTIPYSTTNPDLNYTDASPAGNIPLPSASLTVPAVTVTPAAPYTDAFANTMADIALRFYTNPARTDGTFGTSARQVPIDITDTGPDADRNDFLHMATYALGLGTQGVFYDVDAQRTANPYDTTLPFAWPDPRGGTANFLQRSPVAVDELWHATINGRGLMLSARSPEETRSAMVDVVNNVAARAGAGAAVAVANPNLAPGDNFSYASSYNSGAWSGDLNKFAINLSTGIPETTPQWVSPQQQLAVRQPQNRLIATYNNATNVGTAFTYSNLSAAQQALLTADTTLGTQMVDFLRGDRIFEVEKFKSRGPRPLRDPTTGAYILDGSNYTYLNGIVPRNISVLGDIINSEPVVVRAPQFSYFDAGYAAFRSAQTGRQGVVYQGANDGMLHAFNIDSGAELWAYVPGLVYPTLRNLTDKNAFRHLYYVDGTPTVGDVDFSLTLPNNLASPPDPEWRTLLVGGLRKGGRGYYALNITAGTAGNESDVAAKALWEFPFATTPGRANVGWTFGKPIIAKTRAAGWVVLVTSGYNNGTGAGQSGGDGRGYLWVLNPRDGSVIATLTTNVGTTTQPSGLAQISAFAERPSTDPTIEAVYGGDLLGNLWRFDLSGTTVASWSVTLLAQFRDTANNVQPITTEPELGIVARKRVIFVGTGQYLGDTDVLNNVPENAVARRRMTFYAVKDEGVTGVGPVVHPSSTLRSQLTQQTVTKTTTTIDITNNATNFATQAGWFIDLPEVGERSYTNPALVSGVLAFTSNIPDRSDPCRPGGSSWLYFVDYATGGRVVGATSAGVKIGNVLASRVVVVRTPGQAGSDGTPTVAGKTVGIVRTSDAANTGTQLPTNTAGQGGRRMSWREIPDDQAP